MAARDVAAETAAPWVALNVWGFQDSPVSWGLHEHGFQGSGDNMASFTVFPDGSYIFFAAVGSHDRASF